MRLYHKLALYNIITKLAIIAISGLVILALTYRISTRHLQERLIDKRNKLIKNLSKAEIEELVNMQRSFTDYNILKEEYIILTQYSGNIRRSTRPVFTSENRNVDGQVEEYLILSSYFTYAGKNYKLEIGETMVAVLELEQTILYYTLLTMIISVIVSLVIDIGFTQFLLRPFYWIISQKINNVNDPVLFNYESVNTSTKDFRLLDESISLLMRKLAQQIIKEKQFISNVSHELLTPISIMMSRLENLLNDEALSDEGMNKIVASLKTLRRLKAIIQSLLLISKIENNQYEKSDNINLKRIIEDIYEDLEDRLIEKNITFQSRMQYSHHIKANETLVHILCANIISNAIKYNKRDGKVIISDSLDAAEYNLYIKDEGNGMLPDEIERAFRRYEKLGTTEADSHGLGLAIAKSISDFHNIKISIQSEKNDGTEVRLRFPLQAQPKS